MVSRDDCRELSAMERDFRERKRWFKTSQLLPRAVSHKANLSFQ